MPKGVDGLVTAAIVAKDMARSFPALRMMLMVGIGGGIPNLPKIEIRLGDIVVGTPEGTWEESCNMTRANLRMEEDLS